MRDRTRSIHQPDVDLPAGNRPLVAPIYQTVKFELDSIEDTLQLVRGERDGFFYTRDANPTNRQLETLLASLQGREDCVVSGSGVAAVSTCLLSLCRAGDHVLGFVQSYGPTRYLLQRILARYGVAHTLLSIGDDEGIERVLADRPTRLVCFESPTNPSNDIADIGRICRAARASGALTVMDNTFAGFHNHGQYDVDLFLHSLTKHASGHGDVMGGAVIGSRELISPIRRDTRALGPVLDPHAAFLVLRGMKTYFLRYPAQAATALQVAEWLEAHPAIARVRYPGLASHPRHELACRQMKDFGSVVTLDLVGDGEAARRVVDALRLFAVTASLGSVDSLVMPPQLLQPRDLTPAQLAASGIIGSTIRLSIGAEDPADLIADLEQALARAG